MKLEIYIEGGLKIYESEDEILLHDLKLYLMPGTNIKFVVNDDSKHSVSLVDTLTVKDLSEDI